MFKKFLIAVLVAAVSYNAYYGYQESIAFWSNAIENIKTTATVNR